MPLDPVVLTGKSVELVPLSQEHRDALCEAVRDGELWRLWYTAIPSPETMSAEIERRLGLQAAGSMVPFTVLDGPGGKPVGMTTYMNIEASKPRLEIGSTWYAASVQRSPLNTEAKRLLLEHAFDRIGCIAVEFRTHFMNLASRRAIERIGARLDGILRHHQRMSDGAYRDTCVYSITATDWPTVRTHLDWQIDKPR